jgi:F-type H+-transporting ATPase subunit b
MKIPVSHASRSSWRRVALGFLPALLFTALLAVFAYASGGAAKEEAEGPNWLNFIWRIVNFLVILGFLWWMLAPKARAFFSGRRAGIKESLGEATAAKEDAEKKFAEYSAKIGKATEEIDGIIELIKAQGAVEKEKIIADARMAAEKIKEDTQARMEQEFKKARNDLRTEAVQLSVQMAEEILKRNITAEDHENMVRDYINKVEKER